MSINISFCNACYNLPNGANGIDLLNLVDVSLLTAVIAIRVNGVMQDIRRALPNNAFIELITISEPEALEVVRHSVAHLLAHAVKRLYPKALLGVGPVISDGFYYDFKIDRHFTSEDLILIEKEMHKISEENIVIYRQELQREDAINKFISLGEKMKVEIISDISKDESITCYVQDDFIDLCRGPHVINTKDLKIFKLLYTAGTHWRGNEDNVALCRIYGTAFLNQCDLDEYIKCRNEAILYDHRKIGKQLGLFSFQEESIASPFFHPNGVIVYNELIGYIRSLYLQYGYEEVITPMLLDTNLWKVSGHFDHYSENMYFTEVDNKSYALKPMNCPSHCLIYRTNKRSYKELPIRYADFGRLHRYERSGVTHGLVRVRTFCQDDAHIFCTPENISDEISNFLDFLRRVYDVFHFDQVKVKLSTRPVKRLGNDDLWDNAEMILINALDKSGLEYQINEGDGAFYGPKIDFEVLDKLKRSWQLGTLQMDYSMPIRFNLNYIKADGSEGRPIILHRAILGSIERFIGIYIEHCMGMLPTWLSPIQVAILPITDRGNNYALDIKKQLLSLNIRAKVDLRNEKVNAKIRDAQLYKIPYMLILGDREINSRIVSVRHRIDGNIGTCTLDNFSDNLTKEIFNKGK